MTTSQSFFADSVASALAVARQEVGEDALLIESRPSRPEDQHKGRYEVVVAFPSTPQSRAVTTTQPETLVGQVPSDWKSLVRDVAGLRSQISRLSRMVEQTTAMAPALGDNARFLDQFLEAGVPESAAGRWIAKAATRLAAEPHLGSLELALREEMQSAIPVDSSLRFSDAGPAVVALVGPAGSGKTSSLVKMALRFGVAERRSTVLLTADTLRLGATEQLRAYAAILGVPFASAEDPAQLVDLVQKNQQKQLILIDTPGLTPSELRMAGDLTAALGRIPQLDTHLVLTATTQTADLSGAMERWQMVRPNRLILTHMDEASKHGHAIAAAIEHSLPISFLSWGRRIPEDLEMASPSRLQGLIWEESSIASVAAA